MKLDLHGVKHNDVTNLVIEFISKSNTPCYIITGNSNKMKSIVFEILDFYNCKYYIPSHNLGQIIVTQ